LLLSVAHQAAGQSFDFVEQTFGLGSCGQQAVKDAVKCPSRNLLFT
jgi:hypothetical protein